MIPRKTLLLAAALIIVVAFSMSAFGLFAGSHTHIKNSTSGQNSSAEFCVKCHADTVASVMAGKHKNATCICHGYNPNENATKNFNVAHNMSKEIYCTNCHADYDANGNITIYTSPTISGLNQSAHYLTNDTSKLYNNARNFY